MRKESHYTWLERNFKTIVEQLGLDVENPGRHWGNFTADGDKYYSYQFDWERAGISWYHGAAMYHLMVTYFYKEIRDTKDGWVDPKQWVIDNYNAGHNLGRVMQDL